MAVLPTNLQTVLHKTEKCDLQALRPIALALQMDTK